MINDTKKKSLRAHTEVDNKHKTMQGIEKCLTITHC